MPTDPTLALSHRPQPRPWTLPRLGLLVAVAAAVLAGCAITSPPPSGTPGTPGSAAPAPAGPTLEQERARLADALAGTPVVVEMTPDGQLRVVVPMAFSFDVGRGVVKPPLAAVLDRMASGLKAQTTTEIRVAAPTDPKGAGGLLLVQDRAGSVRDYLVGRGVPATRFVAPVKADDVEVLVRDKAAR